MDINALFEVIMTIINQFADEVATERARGKMPMPKRGVKNKGKK